MPNTITLPKGFTTALDEVYQAAACTSDLTCDPALVKAGANVGEILYPQISVSGLGDYDRNTGYTSGAIDLKWKTAQCNYDRGTKIMVDAMDDQESEKLAFAMGGAELMRTKVAPEGDAFTFAVIAATEGISKMEGETFNSAANFLEALITAKSKMDNDEVPAENRFLYVTSDLLNWVMGLDTTKSREILATFAKKIVVPQGRFYTAIDMLDGKTPGEELGHYKKAETAKDINFMIIHKPAVMKYDKHVAKDIIPASSNADADGDILKYRKYGLVDVYKNKTAGIYMCTK